MLFSSGPDDIYFDGRVKVVHAFKGQKATKWTDSPLAAPQIAVNAKGWNAIILFVVAFSIYIRMHTRFFRIDPLAFISTILNR